MKLEIEEYDFRNADHRRLLEGILPVFQMHGYPTIRTFIYKTTGEFVILDVSEMPSVVWIDYMHIYKTTDSFLSKLEELLKGMKIQTIRYLADINFSPPSKVLCRNINTLIYNKYTVREIILRSSPAICMQKTICKRTTASTTVLNSISEEDHKTEITK